MSTPTRTVPVTLRHTEFNNEIVRDCGARDSTLGSGGKKN